MKTPVTDAAVNEYAAKVRAGLPLGQLFPARMSDCEFTERQREVIRQVRAETRASQRNGKVPPPTKMETKKPANVAPLATALPAAIQRTKTLSKLTKMLYLQSGRCFFCREPLKEEDASIEHLNPKSRGGTSTEDNEVVCHRSLNETFGSLDLKSKFAFVLWSGGSLKCPKT
jgi:5-methylcytosine-specific restriction endonuclease McrA